jgi:hypothetical protein
MMPTRDLLTLRLDALQHDIGKVRLAVDLAQQRGRYLETAVAQLKPCRGKLRALHMQLSGLRTALADEPKIADLLDDANPDLALGLAELPERVDGLTEMIRDVATNLDDAVATTVSLDDASISKLQDSLNRRCNELEQDLEGLLDEVRTDHHGERRKQWTKYRQLLEDVARPLFEEYVDFLGGLTVRDTGLDDRVCEMTDAVLSRFKGVTPGRSLPLPARRAALGNAMDSVVLLGFPEWSIWGIPLVGHEVGLAYVKDQRDEDLMNLVSSFVEDGDPPPTASDGPSLDGPEGAKPQVDTPRERRTQEHVEQLLADVFATYTLGFSYACAALLLRLDPRHDEKRRADRPRDIDRARAIMLTLTPPWRELSAEGGSFSDAVGILDGLWLEGVRAHAGPARAEAAVDEAQGPPPEEDWLDDFTKSAVELFTKQRYTIRSYGEDRWRASETWIDALRSKKVGPSWLPRDESVPDVLTAAWRMRLVDNEQPGDLANDVKERWSEGQKGLVAP